MAGVKGRSGGRNAKTVKQHQLEGTTQKHRHSGYTNADPPLGDPPKPAGLSAVASAEWDRMVERLRLAKTLAVTDDAVLELYVLARASMRRLQAEFDALEHLQFDKFSVDGAGVEMKVRDVVKELRAWNTTIRPYLTELGQTPASRSRVKVPEKSEPEDAFSEFDGLKAVK